MVKFSEHTPFLVIAVAAMISIAASVLAVPIFAATSTTQDPAADAPSKIDDQWIDDHQPERLSDVDLEMAKTIALADTSIQDILAGKTYNFLAVDYVALNPLQEPVQWLADIHYNIDDTQQLGVLVDMSSKQVVKYEVIDIDGKLDANNDPDYDRYLALNGKDPNGYAIARLTGTSQAVKRISSQMIAPTFTNQVNQPLGNVLLVNAQRSNPTSGSACDPAHTSDRYWAQVGLYWKTSGRVTYDDTSTGISGCGNVFPTGISYQSGYDYDFRIYGATTGWQIAMLGPGPVVVNYFGPPINTDTMLTGSSKTSVFFENKIASGTNWAAQFSTNPKSNNALWAPDRVSTQFWPTDSRLDQNCSGGQFFYPYDSTKQVIDHSLTSGATAAYSVSRMQANYFKC